MALPLSAATERNGLRKGRKKDGSSVRFVWNVIGPIIGSPVRSDLSRTRRDVFNRGLWGFDSPIRRLWTDNVESGFGWKRGMDGKGTQREQVGLSGWNVG